jgi:acyl-coenzyme A thioesterase PaaI-like protein
VSVDPLVRAEGFFRTDGDTLVPAEFSTSPWGKVLHGRLIGGLTARAAEAAIAADPELVCGRLTIDMFRSVPLAPVTVSTRAVRTGKRIAVLEVTIEQDGTLVGQGRAVLLRRSEQPPGTFQPAPVWDAPAPPRLGPPEPVSGRGWVPPWQIWRVGDAYGSLSGGLWIRETHPLITGEPVTPLERVAMAADFVSPVSNFSTAGLGFINADYTVYLAREPRGEYVGIQPSGHLSEAGVAVGHCVLYDECGSVGFVSTAAVANELMGSGSRNGDRK